MLLEQGPDGRIRGIILGENEQDILSHVQVLATETVPIGVPWTLQVSYDMVAVTKGEWFKETLTIQQGDFIVEYPEGYDSDAEQMLSWADIAIGRILPHFPDAMDVVSGPVTAVIQEPNGIQHGWAYADINRTAMLFVIPSLSYQENRYYDEDWYLGNIGHEFGHIYLNAIRLQVGGYTRRDVPNWFDEGFGEYLRLLIIGEQRFDEKQGQSYAPAKEQIISSGIAGITDPYGGGAWVFRFLDDEFGLETIKSIITTPTATFWEAIAEQTGLSMSEFDQRLQTWLQNR